ncbi:MAG: c-type cytochrome domain-containing protein [Woeseiaceae bacterium]|jgi:hypothetical protein|nr:c-type cytochrome domain-containing protein [Woeseiaceae bacterium]
MTPNKLLLLGTATLLAGLCGCERQVSFTDDVQPILDAQCVRCHDQAAEGEAVSGLSLKSYADLMQGTRYGKVVVPGSPESSALYLTVAQETSPEIQMPPHHEDKLAMGSGAALTEKKVETIRLWIEQGAPNN